MSSTKSTQRAGRFFVVKSRANRREPLPRRMSTRAAWESDAR